MSNDAAAESSPPPSGPATQGTSPMRSVLFLILGLMIVALAYDFVVARPGQRDAAKKVESLMAAPTGDKMISDAEPIKHAEVIAALGREPASNEEGETFYMERFCWRSGLPWRTHDLYVIYTKTDPRLLHDFAVGQRPESHQFPRPASAAAVKPAAAGTGQPGATPDRAPPPAAEPGRDRGEAADEGGSGEGPEETPPPRPEPAG